VSALVSCSLRLIRAGVDVSYTRVSENSFLGEEIADREPSRQANLVAMNAAETLRRTVVAGDALASARRVLGSASVAQSPSPSRDEVTMIQTECF
jgi:hypothetical protein